MTLIRILGIVAGLVLLPFLTGCGTTKKKDQEVTGLGRLYQNTTAWFNGFFNGEELVGESIASLEQSYNEDFTEVLPLYPYEDVGEVGSVSSDLDAAIEKATIVVALRRKSDWTDDCYLLVGKAQFLKKDYESAEETLRFMLAEYGEEGLELQRIRRELQKKGKKSPKVKSQKRKNGSQAEKSDAEIQAEIDKEERKKQEAKEKKQLQKELDRWRKKYNKAVRARRKGKNVTLPKRPGSEEEEEAENQPEAEDPGQVTASKDDDPIPPPPPPPPPKKEDDPNYFLYRKPAWQEAKLWMARTLLHRDKKEEAIRYLRQLNADPNTFPEVRREIPILQAYIHLGEGELAEAIEALAMGVRLQNDGVKKARYTFILGQLFSEQERYAQAYEAFRKVIKLTNDFEMEFNSRLNMAMAQHQSRTAPMEEIVADLDKMLREDKYVDYRDQIYYTKAMLALEQGDRSTAIANLQKALNVSQRNQSQKANAYLKMADLYFEDENYVKAKSYYDSTLMVLPVEDDDYQRASLWASNLTAIAEAITTIELQDSLLRISRLNETEKRKLAFEIQQKRDEERLRAATQSANGSGTNNAAAIRQPTAAGGGNGPVFFAYDDRVMKRGERNFERRWGDRPLEDNWRRSQRSGAELFAEERAEEAEAIPETVFSEEAIDEILKEVPSTEEEIAAAELMVQDAYFALGGLYRDKLEDFAKSTQSLETLLTRFPDTNLELDAWYLLYLNALETNQATMAERYKSRIIGKYPESNYAMVLQDPNYAREMMEKESEIHQFYTQAYGHFERENVNETHKMCVEAANKFDPEHPMQAKFALLDALAVGKIEGKEAYRQALQKVSTGYRDTDEARQAREMLRLLGGAVASLPGGQEIDMTKFRPEKNAVHYVLVALNDENVNVNIVTEVINDFNTQFFQQSRLRVANIYLGPTPQERKPIIVIRRFKDEAEAMSYYDAYIQNKDAFIGGDAYDVLPISQNNYRQVLRNKTADGYKTFFQQMYVK